MSIVHLYVCIHSYFCWRNGAALARTNPGKLRIRHCSDGSAPVWWILNGLIIRIRKYKRDFEGPWLWGGTANGASCIVAIHHPTLSTNWIPYNLTSNSGCWGPTIATTHLERTIAGYRGYIPCENPPLVSRHCWTIGRVISPYSLNIGLVASERPILAMLQHPGPHGQKGKPVQHARSSEMPKSPRAQRKGSHDT